ncbi:hypothetical protein CMQ_7959 [Grosmannia clavigera kw1407]|uniref:Large ribosomal subunit protein bL21m n=1 Tax=Grosmannia clavigera (strain kw1407 / UAMH 11150) TaxID=655863 RepID=F0XRR1_GROCL|nr:uncharacterized protein CMQ_7959 [Grosmannia clavigera kw1407]EFW99591.1 hypothetical protein CMQ_7959 [Grosmannia clavigera kw1407]
MSGPTLCTLRGALRQSQRGASVLSLQPACLRCVQSSGAATSWARHLSTGRRKPVQVRSSLPAPTQTQLRMRTEQTRSYATPVPDSFAVPSVDKEAATAAPTLSVSLASILQQMSASAAPSHPSVYATVHIYGRPYLVTPGDRLRLPFRMAGVQPGDVLHLDRVGVVGSRSVTAVGGVTGAGGGGPEGEGIQRGGHVPGVSVTAVVLGLETEPLRLLVKKKRRNRRKKTVRSKHQYTVLRIQDVRLGDESA